MITNKDRYWFVALAISSNSLAVAKFRDFPIVSSVFFVSEAIMLRQAFKTTKEETKDG